MSRGNICCAMTKSDLPRKEPLQVDKLAMVLHRAYYEEPRVKYIMPDEQARLRLLPDLFRVAIHATQRYGEIRTTQSLDAGALCLGPGSGLTLRGIIRSGFSSISLQLERTTL